MRVQHYSRPHLQSLGQHAGLSGTTTSHSCLGAVAIVRRRVAMDTGDGSDGRAIAVLLRPDRRAAMERCTEQVARCCVFTKGRGCRPFIYSGARDKLDAGALDIANTLRLTGGVSCSSSGGFSFFLPIMLRNTPYFAKLFLAGRALPAVYLPSQNRFLFTPFFVRLYVILPRDL